MGCDARRGPNTPATFLDGSKAPRSRPYLLKRPIFNHSTCLIATACVENSGPRSDTLPGFVWSGDDLSLGFLRSHTVHGPTFHVLVPLG